MISPSNSAVPPTIPCWNAGCGARRHRKGSGSISSGNDSGSDSSIRRLDRVLVLDGQSLLWALDPLQAASEGEVVITLTLEETQERLQAQLQVLDQLRRPRLLLIPADAPAQLAAALGLGPDASERFEWIVARQPFRHCSRESVEAWLDLLTGLAARTCQARFLFSQPLLGPAAGLLQHLEARANQGSRATSSRKPGALGGDLHTLRQLVPLETHWLRSGAAEADAVASHLETRGWLVERETWRESLQLPMGENLLGRWFGPKADYRLHLEEHLGTEAIAELEALFRCHKGTSLLQTLCHTLLVARRK